MAWDFLFTAAVIQAALLAPSDPAHRLTPVEERRGFVVLTFPTRSVEDAAGARNPSLDTLCRLASALGCDPGDLVEGLHRLPGRH